MRRTEKQRQRFVIHEFVEFGGQRSLFALARLGGEFVIQLFKTGKHLARAPRATRAGELIVQFKRRRIRRLPALPVDKDVPIGDALPLCQSPQRHEFFGIRINIQLNAGLQQFTILKDFHPRGL